MFAKDLHGDAFVDAVGINSVCLPGKSLCEQVPEHFSRPDVLRSGSEPGADIDAIVGWKLGTWSLEAELGWKRLKRDGLQVDQDFLDYSNAILHRPLNLQPPGTAGAPPLVSGDFDTQSGKVTVKSVMANVIADVYAMKRTSFYAGAGVGSAWAQALRDHDHTWAAQAIAGFKTRVSAGVELGLRYRYFRTGGLHFAGEPREFVGNEYIAFAGGLQFNKQDSATITPHLHGQIGSHSLVAGLAVSLR
jgi:hypothetical protein